MGSINPSRPKSFLNTNICSVHSLGIFSPRKASFKVIFFPPSDTVGPMMEMLCL